MFERLCSFTYFTEFGMQYRKLKLKMAQIDYENNNFNRFTQKQGKSAIANLWVTKFSELLVAEILRSEFWLEIKILFYKSTPGNTKMASELKLDAK